MNDGLSRKRKIRNRNKHGLQGDPLTFTDQIMDMYGYKRKRRLAATLAEIKNRGKST